jgi:asparagine synthase (glutamine-hydrolysing)
LDYHELKVTESDLLTQMQRASWLYGEPLTHGNDLHILAISEYAKNHVTVLLSGEGADETLGGYIRYQPLRYPALFRHGRQAIPFIAGIPRVGSRVRKIHRFMQLGGIDRFIVYNSCDVLPYELRSVGLDPEGQFPYREAILKEAEELYPGEPVRQVMFSDQHTFLCSLLDRNDRMTMGASIECRVPMLDYRLVEGTAAISTHDLFGVDRRRGKRLLRDSVGRKLPPNVRYGRKWGFGTPWNRYLREQSDLRAFVQDLTECESIKSGPFERSKLRSLLDDFVSGNDQHLQIVRQLVMIAIWYEGCIKSPARRYIDGAENLAVSASRERP